ncbi:4'-phosphopantetheinyl transferase superfamily protein [Streptomyces sp. NPDC002138]|uniref:4'-phosphopantetheinyl transferase family protein n=1 Tax=Streptomyces sp. NPDC002138 TaxID=3154410 RepID=UPI003327BCEC
MRSLPAQLRQQRPRLPGLGFGTSSLHEGPPPGVRAAERALAATMPPARRSEFLIGRCALHRALRDAGIEAGAVLFDGRGPGLPPGVTGSISHANGMAVAIAARTHEVLSLGIDVEFTVPPLEAAHLVLGPGDQRSLVTRRGEVARDRLLRAFSAKEAAFKALSPLVGAAGLPGLRAVRLEPLGAGFAAWPVDRPELVAEVTVRPLPAGVLSWAALRP